MFWIHSCSDEDSLNCILLAYSWFLKDFNHYYCQSASESFRPNPWTSIISWTVILFHLHYITLIPFSNESCERAWARFDPWALSMSMCWLLHCWCDSSIRWLPVQFLVCSFCQCFSFCFDNVLHSALSSGVCHVILFFWDSLFCGYWAVI